MSDCNAKEFDSDDSNIYEVEFVYGKKMFKKKTLYAVKWLGWTKSQMSWEPFSNFTSISSYLVRRLETRLCYAQYYKKIAPTSGGIRVHIKGKFCQVQEIDANLQQKTIECEKKIASNSSDTQDLYDKAQKIITQMKQNLLCSINRKQHLKSQKKVNKQNNHIKTIINLQEKNQAISLTDGTLIVQEQIVPKQIKKKQKLNKKKIIDQELERDIQFLINNEKQTKKIKQANCQQILIKNDNFQNGKDQKQQQQQQQQQQKLLLFELEQQKNNNQNYCECQIILNEPYNSESIIPFKKQIKKTNCKNTQKYLKQQKNNNNQQVVQNLSNQQQGKSESKLKNIQGQNFQETHSYPQEESFEIDLLLAENSEQQMIQGGKLKDIEKPSDICVQNIKILPYSYQNNQFQKVRVVKSVPNSYMNEKQLIPEIIEEQKKGQSELHQGLNLKQLLQMKINKQSNQKTSQQIQQEIQKIQQDKIILNQTSRCSMAVIPKLKDVEVQYFENNILNSEMIQYDLDLNEIRFHKINVEIIESHHLLIGKLLFKCLYDNGIKYYLEYDKLQIYCPTLLLDYMIVNSILI